MLNRSEAMETARLAVLLDRMTQRQNHTAHSAQVLARCSEELMCIERIARRDATNLCNVPDFQPRFDRSRKRLKKRLANVFATLNVTVTCELHGDPRGSCLVLFHQYLPGSPDEGFRVG